MRRSSFRFVLCVAAALPTAATLQAQDTASKAAFAPAPATTAHDVPVTLPTAPAETCIEALDADADSVALARGWFEQGIAHVEHNEWLQAEQCFRRVLTVRSSPVVSYNLASALARLGRMVESAELLRVVVRDPGVDASTREPAQQLLAEIEPQIGSLTVRVLGDMRGVVLRLDDRVLGDSKPMQALSLDPGSHMVIAERDGTKLEAARVEIGGIAPLKAEVMLDLTDKRPPVERPDPRVSLLASEKAAPGSGDSNDSLLASPWLWTGVGAGVVAVAATIIVVAVGGGGGSASPVDGDTDPPLIRGRVAEVP